MGSMDASDSAGSERSAQSTKSSASGLTAITKGTSWDSLHPSVETAKNEDEVNATTEGPPSKATSNSSEMAGDEEPKGHESQDGGNISDTSSEPSITDYNDDDESGEEAEFSSSLRSDMLYAKHPEDITSAAGKAGLRNKQALSYFFLVEARIKALERDLSTLRKRSRSASKSSLAYKEEDTEIAATEEPPVEARSTAGDSIPGDLPQHEDTSTSDDDEWDLKVAWKTFADFAPQKYSDKDLSGPVIDVLCEPVPVVFERSSRTKPRHSARKPDSRLKREIIQVRINSGYICDAFTLAARKKSPGRYLDNEDKVLTPGEGHIKPFKAFVEYDAELRQVLADLNKTVNSFSEATEPETATPAEPTPVEGAFVYGKSIDDQPDDPLEDPDRQKTIALHLKVFLDFVDEHLRSDFETYRQLRTREIGDAVPKVNFGDLWKLFSPGDEVYSASGRQVYIILAVCGGRHSLRDCEEKDNCEGERGDGSYSDRYASDFSITCFNLSFNGTQIGPVQHEIPIPQFEGSRSITRLPVFPIEYADFYEGLHKTGKEFSAARQNATSPPVREQLIERGRRFSELANKTIYHRDYDGYSLSVAKHDRMQELQEQIDSEIIIDFEKFFQLYPGSKPVLGMNDIPEGPERETKQIVTRKCGCSAKDCTYDVDINLLYDDRNVDEARKNRLMERISDIVRWRSVGEGTLRTKEEYCLLFPGHIFAFVLKNRTWYELDVSDVHEIPRNRRDFEQLVLPEDHKLIVRSLVETHKIGPKAAITAKQIGPQKPQRPESTIREDLVRGKGKGLIVLLHGVPGVGKTSTAECVAEYTGRPLFALTCGDLGESPDTVQEKLQECFTLAYRWSCVMLLDEADVFLQRRDKTDLKRNAVVSVFLRTLEYYSGILFLTTNRVGVFDEAFKSRIHVSLYYEPLKREQAEQIWNVNFDRIQTVDADLKLKKKKLMKWAKKAWSEDDAKEGKQWNGRQIHNAVRTAAALAAFTKDHELTSEHLDIVAKTSRDFDVYLKDTTGRDDWTRAQDDGERFDPRLVSVLQAFAQSPEWAPPGAQRRTAPQSMHWTNGPVNGQQPAYGQQMSWGGAPQQTPVQTPTQRKTKRAKDVLPSSPPPPQQPPLVQANGGAAEDDSEDSEESESSDDE